MAIGISLTGTPLDDTLPGTADDDTLDGLAGNDLLQGLRGNDSLLGGEGNDVLDGGEGVDTLDGGAGDDTYMVDTLADVIVEGAGAGTDTVVADLSWSLAANANVENLTLVGTARLDGTGNALDNRIEGNTGRNVLTGGLGNDTYVVDVGDTVVELADEGLDTVLTAVDWTLEANVENLTLTGASRVNGTGNALGNVITGNDTVNLLDGQGGADTLAGGGGRDTYVVDDAGDVVLEGPAGDLDTVQSSVSWTLGANLEDLVLTGTAAIDGTGNALDNTLTGNSAANVLAGGQGEDIYFADAGDTVVELAGEGRKDEVDTAIDWTLGDNVENLVLLGTADVNGTGNALDNTLQGNAGANLLDGLAGGDGLLGGLGDDTYVVDDVDDLVTENLDEGTDTVRASLSHGLAANVENLVLTGAAAINATGNALANVLTGNSGSNTLDGLAGADTLAGGLGDDTYVVTLLDTILENAGEGIDTAVTTSRFTLAANVENLVLAGASAISGTGNELDNRITGNSAANTLDGQGGNDTMAGGDGNDTYVIDAIGDVVVENSGAGIDTVESALGHVLGASIENLTLTGAAAIDGTGNALDNVITGNDAANVLAGGAGNDSYFVTSIDTIRENAGAGIDTAFSASTCTLWANVENLVLTGGAALNATGNVLANQITGNRGANILNGRDGADTMAGGAGNDTYVVDAAGDVVVEDIGGGIDTVSSAVTYTLGANVEKLVLAGVAAIDGSGNALDNEIVGNSAANVLSGGAGNDSYVVGFGDAVVESAAEGVDTILSSLSWTLAAEVENLVLTGTASLAGTGNALANTITGTSGANTLDGGAGADALAGGLGNDTYVVDDAADSVTENAGAGTDTVRAGLSWVLGAHLENLTLTGAAAIDATGNAVANVITGNGAANVLDGGLGADTLRGGAGDDTYVVESALDLAIENAGEGVDTVLSSVTKTLAANLENLGLLGGALNGTGNALANRITGTDAGNVLDGKAGNDTLAGGLGDDTYVVDALGDVVLENPGQGIDTVQSSVGWTLAADFEHLTLTGTLAINGSGNALDNFLRGNSAANVLAGGAGNDSYFVTSLDTIVENAGEGVDTAVAATTFTLGANVENLVLAGTSLFSGTGNALDNQLTGNGAANTLDGKAGADTLAGGAGNDTYVVDAADAVLENAGEGLDTVRSAVAWTLGDNVENLALTGTGAVDGTGNALDNVLAGNSESNILDGLAGNDVLRGLGGNDVLRDLSGGGSMEGGVGADVLQAGGKAFLAGGTGNDRLEPGTGAQVLAFNAGDGLDVLAGSGAQDDTVSLGKIRFADLHFTRAGDDLTLSTGTGQGLVLQGWFAGQQTVATLQMVIDGTADYDPASADVLHQSKVLQFDFAALATQFAQQGATPGWALAPALDGALVSAGDTAALGGNLAMLYAHNGSLDAAAPSSILSVVGAPEFGLLPQDFVL